jgi:cytochrome c-type biogenesis protein CcmH
MNSASLPMPLSAPAAPSLRLWLAIGAFVLLFGAGGYAWLGRWDAWSVGPESARQANTPAAQAQQVEAMVARLAERLKQEPNNAQGWLMLGRSYAAMERHAEAVPALRKAIELNPKDAQAYADLADAVGMVNGRSLEGEPAELVAKALALDPQHLKALALAGTMAFQKGDYARAVKHWETAVAQAEPGSELVRNLQDGIAQARQRGHLPPGEANAQPRAPANAPANAPAAAMAEAPAPAAAAGPAEVSGRVSLAPALKGQVSPEDTVFVFARAAQGPRMPLAIVKKQVKDLPFDFKLDDSLAMSPAARLSGAAQVVVGARISKSGNAMPQPGDLQGLTAPLAPTGAQARGLAIEINQPVQ